MEIIVQIVHALKSKCEEHLFSSWQNAFEYVWPEVYSMSEVTFIFHINGFDEIKIIQNPVIMDIEIFKLELEMNNLYNPQPERPKQ